MEKSDKLHTRGILFERIENGYSNNFVKGV